MVTLYSTPTELNIKYSRDDGDIFDQELNIKYKRDDGDILDHPLPYVNLFRDLIIFVNSSRYFSCCSNY